MVNIGVYDYLFIEIYDSGESFDLDVLKHAGIVQTTTHNAAGGSGIGLMSTFKLLSKYNVSFCIDEFRKNTRYTKKVSICFDNLGEYRISSFRCLQLKSYIARADILYSDI